MILLRLDSLDKTNSDVVMNVEKVSLICNG